MLVAWVLTWTACRSGPAHELHRLAPEMPSPLAEALIAGGDAQLRRALRASPESCGMLWRLYAALPTDSIETFSLAEAQIEGYATVFVAAIAAEFPEHDVLRRHAAYLQHPLRHRLEIVRSMASIQRLAAGLTSPIEEQERYLRTLMEDTKPYASVIDLGDLYGNYANLLPRLNRKDEMAHYLRLGIETALENGFTNSSCQMLGTLGCIYQAAGDEENMRACWDQALQLARAGNSWQAARILSFYASHHGSLGQFAVTRDLLLQAQDRCRELQASWVELRFLYTSLQMFGTLGCWEMVGRNLPRAEVLERQGREYWNPLEADLWAGRLQQMRASYLAAIGAQATAESLALDLVRRLDRWQPMPPREECRLSAARVLLAGGRTREAQSILQAGIEACRSRGMPELLEDYSLELARAYLALGDLPRCQAALEDFRSHVSALPSNEVVRNWIHHDALSVRLALRMTGRAAAIQQLELALERLAQMQRELSAGPEAYLALAIADELRELAHQLTDGSPEAGYALEMAWRRFRARPSRGPESGSATGSVSLAATARHTAPTTLMQRLRARRAVHCVYDVRDSNVIRWTATADGVARDQLDMPRVQLEALVGRIVERLADRPDAGAPLDAQTLQDLHHLANQLLPDAARNASPSTLLLLSPESFLSRIPFEALNLSSSGFQPLLSACDVAYLRLWREPATSNKRQSIVISRPDYPPGLRRRYSVLNEDLLLGAKEAELFRALLPRSTPLAGTAATKFALMERWEQARFLYFACHLVQDQEVPYIAFIPMATAATGRDADAYLELADILGADLSGCELVVLSSCASGVPYVEGRVASPSLGDAFVDAGAGAVVSTFWNVRDDAAARAMREFARDFRKPGADPVATLCASRRRLLQAGASPHEWAAYSITLGGL